MLALTITRRVSQRFSNFLLHVPMKKETDLETLEQQVYNKRTADLNYLCRTTKYKREEIKKMYRGFKQRCPSGTATEEFFKDIYAELFPHGDPSAYAHLVFVQLDENHVGKFTFEEFIKTLSLIARGNVRDKLRWVFRLYDANRDGYVCLSDVKEVLSAVYRMLGKYTTPPYDDQSPMEHAREVFERFSKDENAFLTEEEFISACLKDRTLLKSITNLDTIIQ